MRATGPRAGPRIRGTPDVHRECDDTAGRSCGGRPRGAASAAPATSSADVLSTGQCPPAARAIGILNAPAPLVVVTTRGAGARAGGRPPRGPGGGWAPDPSPPRGPFRQIMRALMRPRRRTSAPASPTSPVASSGYVDGPGTAAAATAGRVEPAAAATTAPATQRASDLAANRVITARCNGPWSTRRADLALTTGARIGAAARGHNPVV